MTDNTAETKKKKRGKHEKADERIIFSSRMTPKMAKDLNIQASIENRYMYEIIEEAVNDYMENKGAKKRKEAGF